MVGDCLGDVLFSMRETIFTILARLSRMSRWSVLVRFSWLIRSASACYRCQRNKLLDSSPKTLSDGDCCCFQLCIVSQWYCSRNGFM
jgi:hypothetical protein